MAARRGGFRADSTTMWTLANWTREVLSSCAKDRIRLRNSLLGPASTLDPRTWSRRITVSFSGRFLAGPQAIEQIRRVAGG
jgi:hypothetical protein